MVKPHVLATKRQALEEEEAEAAEEAAPEEAEEAPAEEAPAADAPAAEGDAAPAPAAEGVAGAAEGAAEEAEKEAVATASKFTPHLDKIHWPSSYDDIRSIFGMHLDWILFIILLGAICWAYIKYIRPQLHLHDEVLVLAQIYLSYMHRYIDT